jgi:hypothetical protein
MVMFDEESSISLPWVIFGANLGFKFLSPSKFEVLM